MALSAIESVGDALSATRRFLFPFDRVRWFRLAVVMLFVAGTGLSVSVPGVPGGDPSPDPGVGQPEPAPGQPDPSALTPELTPELLVLVVAVAAVGLALVVAWGVVSATMEFVFVASLRAESVRLVTFFTRNWRKGLRVWAFRLAVWLVAIAGALAPTLLLGLGLGGWPPTGWADGTLAAVVLLGAVALLTAAVVAGTVNGFTTLFVVPVMLLEDRTVLSGWRRFWGTLTGEWTEYLAYLVVNFLLGIAVGIASGILTLVAGVAIAVPVLIVAVPTVALLGLSAVTGTLLLVLAFVAGLLFVVAGLLVAVPFQTFLRYYALFVLGDTNPEFDAVPDARAAVRADGGSATDDADDAPPGGPSAGTDGPAETEGSDASTAGDAGPGESDPTDDGWNVDRDDRE